MMRLTDLPITGRQIEALRALNRLKLPTMERWATELGVCYGTITHFRRALEARDLITRERGVGRSLQLTDAGRAVIKQRRPKRTTKTKED